MRAHIHVPRASGVHATHGSVFVVLAAASPARAVGTVRVVVEPRRDDPVRDARRDLFLRHVVGFDHPIKGQGIYAFVTLMIGENFDDEFNNELKQFVSKAIGAIAKPDLIQNAPGLPKTRSGKIMRRILRKIAEGDLSNLGDTTTLADPTVVESLIENKQSL